MIASGETGRLTADWPTTPVPADWVISRYQRTLVARSRQQALDNDYVKAYIRLNRQNVVGHSGVMFRSLAVTARGKPDTDARIAVELFLAAWGLSENCDVCGKLSWRATQCTAIESAARDGEFFFRWVFGEDAGQFGVALQAVDAQRCPVDYHLDGLPNGAYVRHGIEFTRAGRPRAYYFSEPAPWAGVQTYSHGGTSYVRVPADDVIHGFTPEMTGQKRGLPWLTSGLSRAKHLHAMEEAAVINARAGAANLGVMQWREGQGPDDEPDEDYELEVEPGVIPFIPAGAELTGFQHQYPSGEFAPFAKHQLRGLAAGGGASYHSLSQDLTEVNFSSIRHGTLDERDTYKDRQEFLIDDLCRKVFPVILGRALLAGKVVTAEGKRLSAADMVRLLPHEWSGRRWQWIDPRADMDAAEGTKNNLLTAPSTLIRDQGKDPEKVWRAYGEDIQAMVAAGIPMELIAISMGRKPTPAPTA